MKEQLFLVVSYLFKNAAYILLNIQVVRKQP